MAKNNIVETIKRKYESSKVAYESVRNNKVKIINDISGKDIGDRIIPSDVIEQQNNGASVRANAYSNNQ